MIDLGEHSFLSILRLDLPSLLEMRPFIEIFVYVTYILIFLVQRRYSQEVCRKDIEQAIAIELHPVLNTLDSLSLSFSFGCGEGTIRYSSYELLYHLRLLRIFSLKAAHILGHAWLGLCMHGPVAESYCAWHHEPHPTFLLLEIFITQLTHQKYLTTPSYDEKVLIECLLYFTTPLNGN